MTLPNDIARCTGETHRDEHLILCPVRHRCKRFTALVQHTQTPQAILVMSPPTPGEPCCYFMEAEIHES